MNVLNMDPGAIRKFRTLFYREEDDTYNEGGAIEGIIYCLEKSRMLPVDNADLEVIWEDILDKSKNPNYGGITYIFVVTTGGSQRAYVGKTLKRFVERYPKNPEDVKGGLKEVLDYYAVGESSLDIILYNTSHPALVEIWCYHLLVSRGYTLTNKLDPS